MSLSLIKKLYKSFIPYAFWGNSLYILFSVLNAITFMGYFKSNCDYVHSYYWVSLICFACSTAIAIFFLSEHSMPKKLNN